MENKQEQNNKFEKLEKEQLYSVIAGEAKGGGGTSIGFFAFIASYLSKEKN